MKKQSKIFDTSLRKTFEEATQTAQQKAEAYVRAQLPELMELREGCRVKVKFIDGDWVKGMVVESVLPNIPAVVHFHGMPSQYITETTKYKIIGHPIQLVHILRLVHEDLQSEALGNWDLYKPWKRQHEGLYRWLCEHWKLSI